MIVVGREDVMAAIRDGTVTMSALLQRFWGHMGVVHWEWFHFERTLDRHLQALRRAGRIRYDRAARKWEVS